MGIRINRGIFQFQEGDTFVNKFKLAEDGTMVDVDAEGTPTNAYLKVGDTATNADTLDGFHATNAAGGVPVLNSSNGYWYAPSWIHLNEGRGIFSTHNGAHFLPNNQGQYGAWRIIGTRNGWEGLHFGGSSGVTLMMNETESGIHRNGVGWKYRHQSGNFYVYTGTNGGGTGYPVWHEGNLTPISYATGSFTVGGDPETYYPVMLNKSSRTTGRFVIYRDNVHQDESNRGAGRLVLNGYTSGWGHVPLTLHYETKISGSVLWKFLASNYRTGLMVVYLKGATTYYYKSEHGFTLHDANGQGEAKSDGRTNWLPTPQDDSSAAWEGEGPSVLTIEHGVSYYDGTLKAGRFKGNGTDITNVNAETLDGIDSGSFLRSDAGDTASGKITFTSNESAEPFSPIEIRGGGNHTGLYINPHTNKQAHIRFAANGALKWQIRAPFQDGVNSPLKIYSWVDSADKFTFNHDGSLVASSFVGALSGNASTATTSTYLGSYYHADTWFRAKSDSTTVKFYGNSRMMVFRTDGEGGDEGHTGYAFKWTYGGNGTGSSLMLLDNNGNLWTKSYGWLHSRFETAGAADAVNLRIEEEILPAIDSKLGATAKAADSNLLDGIDSSAFIRENQDRRHKVIRFTGESGDSGNTAQNYAIYQAGGAWTHPYPDLVIAMHTGIKIGGYKNYGGVRIYNDAPERSGAEEVASFGNGDANVRVSNNLHIGSAGGWITDLLNGKETAGAADAVNLRIEEEILPAIDGKLGSTAKAADSNLLDGIDSSRFVYGGNSTRTTNISNASTALNSGFYDGYNITGTPTNTWYTYINMRHNNTGNNYGSQIAVSFYSNADMYVRTISNGTYHGWSKIWNAANFNPTDKAITESVAAAQPAAIAHTDNRLDSEILPIIDSKLDATGKAADADKLDGYDWMQSGKSVRANEFYADNWFRNYNSNEGLYNEATTQHWYSDGDDYWNIAGGGSFNAIRFRDEHNGTQRGLVGADSSNRIGFLDAGGAWAVRHDNDSGTLFYTDGETLEFRVGRDKVTGDYGTVQADTNKNGWGGYSIYGQYVLMSNGSRIGIYNDIDNEWMIQCYRNAQVELRHNGAIKLETTSGGVSVTGAVTATTFSGGLDWANVTNKPVIPAATEPVQAIVEGGNNSTLSSITFSEGEGAATFTLADGQSFRLAFAR